VLDGFVKLHLCQVLDKHLTQVLYIFRFLRQRREKLGKEYNLKSYAYDQFSQALEDGECDAFYIATPNNQHGRFAVPALEKGFFYIIFILSR
jgi:predicted dehydrogenase